MEEKTSLEQATVLSEQAVAEFDKTQLERSSVLTHDIAYQMYSRAVSLKSGLDPEGRAMYKALAEMEKEPLPEFPINWEKLAMLAYQEVRHFVHHNQNPKGAKTGVRVMESMFTKKNRVRLVKDDPKSPMGTILKYHPEIDALHKPWAFAEFSAMDVFKYAVEKLPDTPSWLTEDRDTLPDLIGG